MPAQKRSSLNAANVACSPLSIGRMLCKRWLPIVAVWVVFSVAAPIVVYRLPAKYRATAVLVVDSQQIPDKYVPSTVVTEAGDRLAAITQEIRSASSLEKIIEEFDLYHKERQRRFREDVLNMMKDDINTSTTWTGRTASFHISYDSRDPTVAAQVANRLAGMYVEENLKARESQADGTSEFIEGQLKEAKQKLDELEAAVSRYKLQHNGELPQQADSLNGLLARLGVAVEASRDAMNRAEQQKVVLQNSLGAAQDTEASLVRQLKATAASAGDRTPVLSIPGIAAPRSRSRAEELESQLAELRTRYSEQHPEVKRVAALLEQARREQERRAESSVERITAEAPNSGVPEKTGTGAMAPKPAAQDIPVPAGLAEVRERIASLRAQLKFEDQEIENGKREQQRLMGEISTYQSRVNAMPIREQEMAALTRDYEISKANYRSLQDKKIGADMAADMERREKAERFIVVDPARIPARPFSPKRLLLSICSSALGLILGLALGLGKELNSGLLLGEWELPAGVPILGRLPHIEITAGEAG